MEEIETEETLPTDLILHIMDYIAVYPEKQLKLRSILQVDADGDEDELKNSFEIDKNGNMNDSNKFERENSIKFSINYDDSEVALTGIWSNKENVGSKKLILTSKIDNNFIKDKLCIVRGNSDNVSLSHVIGNTIYRWAGHPDQEFQLMISRHKVSKKWQNNKSICAGIFYTPTEGYLDEIGYVYNSEKIVFYTPINVCISKYFRDRFKRTFTLYGKLKNFTYGKHIGGDYGYWISS